MCPPAIAIAGLAISAAAAGASAMSANKSEKATAKTQIANTHYTLANFANQVNSNNTKYAQEVEQLQEQQQQIYLNNLKQKATAQASAAGSGVAGISIDNLFRGYDRTSALSNFIAERNIRNMGLQYDENYEALRTNAINSIYGLPQYQGASASSTLMSGMGGILSSQAMSNTLSELSTKLK